MLVLSRKVGEAINLGDDIRIVVVRISGGSVRLGIEAPPGLNIAREELQRRIASAFDIEPATAVSMPQVD